MQYLVIIEKANGNFSAYLPDVPGCVATGKTPEEAMKAITEALAMHLDGLAQDGIPLPQPAARADYVAVPMAT